jgi:hypothetical protein
MTAERQAEVGHDGPRNPRVASTEPRFDNRGELWCRSLKKHRHRAPASTELRFDDCGEVTGVTFWIYQEQTTLQRSRGSMTAAEVWFNTYIAPGMLQRSRGSKVAEM